MEIFDEHGIYQPRPMADLELFQLQCNVHGAKVVATDHDTVVNIVVIPIS